MYSQNQISDSYVYTFYNMRTYISTRFSYIVLGSKRCDVLFGILSMNFMGVDNRLILKFWLSWKLYSLRSYELIFLVFLFIFSFYILVFVVFSTFIWKAAMSIQTCWFNWSILQCSQRYQWCFWECKVFVRPILSCFAWSSREGA